MRTVLALFLTAMAAGGATPKPSEATIIDTGSTNRTGLRVTFDENGAAVTEAGKAIKLSGDAPKRLLDLLKDAGPVAELPARHCMKSASFGSRLYIEFGGQRSPDLSCPGQEGSKTGDLRDLALKVVESARAAANIPAARRVER